MEGATPVKINGRLRKLEVKMAPDGVGWGVYCPEFGSWLSNDGGHTTHLDFNGRLFQTEWHAQAYVQGYEAAIAEMAETLTTREPADA